MRLHGPAECKSSAGQINTAASCRRVHPGAASAATITAIPNVEALGTPSLMPLPVVSCVIGIISSTRALLRELCRAADLHHPSSLEAS